MPRAWRTYWCGGNEEEVSGRTASTPRNNVLFINYIDSWAWKNCWNANILQLMMRVSRDELYPCCWRKGNLCWRCSVKFFWRTLQLTNKSCKLRIKNVLVPFICNIYQENQYLYIVYLFRIFEKEWQLNLNSWFLFLLVLLNWFLLVDWTNRTKQYSIALYDSQHCKITTSHSSNLANSESLAQRMLW